MRDINIGDKVILALNSPGSVGITDGLRKFKDQEFIVKRVVYTTDKGMWRFVYELDGCVSSKGVPFTFTSDWIRRVEEE